MYQSIPFKNIRVIIRKQNFNLIVDAARPTARHTDHCQSISQNFSLKNPANKSADILLKHAVKTKTTFH